jgi:hypothetical protein
MPVSKALGIMHEMIGSALDAACVDALTAGLGRLTPAAAAAA